MKARHQRNQNSPSASRPHWQGKTSQSLRESWSTAPAATLPAGNPPGLQASVAHPKTPARDITREELPVHASNPLVDLEALEQRFFAEGMSEDALAAASAREEELEQQREFSRTGAGAGSKLLLGGAMCAALAVVVGGTLIRQLNASGASPVPLVTTQVVAAATPPPAPPPTAPVAQTTPASVVDVTALRAGTASAAAAAAAVAVVQSEPAAAAQNTPQDAQAACAQVLRRGRFREMNQWCAAAFAQAPSSELAGRMAEMALERGRHGDAAVWARRAIHHNPRFALAFVYLGGAEQELGHMDAARTAYNRYLALEPEGQHADDIRALLNAGD